MRIILSYSLNFCPLIWMKITIICLERYGSAERLTFSKQGL